MSTIAAVSTPPGEGGISIIRISGDEAITIADKIFRNPCGKRLCDAGANTVTYGHALTADGAVADEVLVTVFRSPHSYTGEDVAEINCHGGMISTREILSSAVAAGAQPAAPGEFTKRAFMNGRIDLAQAESVIDIINSTSTLSHTVAVNQLGGALSHEINNIREKLLSLLAHIQVLIDYPDEDLEPLSENEFDSALADALDSVRKLLSTADSGAIIKGGVATAIVGKPNVGKSSLLNLLAGHERAIVTDIAGTTRDAIEESVNLGSVSLRLADTAGIHDTDDVIENIGVGKSKKYISDSQLVLFVADGKSPLDDDDRAIISAIGGKRAVALINKTEDGCAFEPSELGDNFEKVIMFSVHAKKGVDELTKTVETMFDIGKISNGDGGVVTNIRHKDALMRAEKFLSSAIGAMRSGIPQDMISVDIQSAVSSLGEIVGQTVGEEVVDRIFHNFCLGK